MKTVLLTWELGSGLGHVGPLLRLAREFRRRGHRAVFALRDVVGPRALLADEEFTVLQAPRWTPASAPGRPYVPAGYGDLLAESGFGDAEDLRALTGAWDALIGLVKPDLIVADHSPTACLAAYRTIPLVVAGNGFMVPPVHGETFPPHHPRRSPMAREARLLENIREVQSRRGRPCPPTLPALFAAPVRAVAVFPQLDPYRGVRREPVIGPFEPMPAPSPVPGDSSVFAYLGEENPALEALVAGLCVHKGPVEAYLRGNVGGLRRLLASRGARVHEVLPPLSEVVSRVSVVVSQAASTTAHAALAAGRPQVVAPTHAETELTADALVELGVGVRLPAEPDRDQVAAALARAARGSGLRLKAETVAAQVACRPALDAVAAVADAGLRQLS